MEKELEELLATPKLSALETMRHSCAHVLAHAITRLYPGSQFGVGPHIEHGFYYDILFPEHVTEDILPKLEDEMKKIIKEGKPFVRKVLSKEEAVRFFGDHGQLFKIELIKDLNLEKVGTYEEGAFTDMCQGPHLENTSQIKAFKLTHMAGAYWRGSEKNQMLTRIYGLCFNSNKELEEHLRLLEEAKKRDHRKLGKELDLFSFHQEAAAMPFFHPRGAIVYNSLQNFIRKLYTKYGYEEVITPQILDVDLWHKSGHYDNYKENMYFSQQDERDVAMKPMNCPCHAMIFSTNQHSYRELPIRYADFGRLHRYERSGVTAGLTRVRSFAQDDAHIFCTEDQIGEEVADLVKMIREAYQVFGFPEPLVYLSTRPEKSVGSDEMWKKAEAFLEEAIKKNNLNFKVNPGDGAFYGPKIDFNIKDAIGRYHQLSTIQLDFSMPERFGLEYVDADNSRKRPVMIHRAVLGSLERFMGILIEHCSGAFPFWVAPLQARFVPINDSHAEYCHKAARKLRSLGFRVDVDDSNNSMGAKTREAQTQKIPYMLAVGDREIQANSFSARKYGEKVSNTLTEEQVIEAFTKLSDPLLPQQ
ncbi:MAG: threonine--tRNA ligase [Oligoflexia bacterium]|nr:threonine--tRNA ligase [Oligoflexia bacterium]